MKYQGSIETVKIKLNSYREEQVVGRLRTSDDVERQARASETTAKVQITPR